MSSLPLALMLLTGCARELADVDRADALTPGLGEGPVPVRGSGIATDDHVSLLAQPSSVAAGLLPAGARYRLIVATSPGAGSELALAILAGDDRVIGRLLLRPRDEFAGHGVSLEYDGPGLDLPVRIEARAVANHIEGEVTVADARGHWRVRVDGQGQLVGERWHPPKLTARRGPGHDELAQARAIADDLWALAEALVDDSPLVDRQQLQAQLELASVALDQSLALWAGPRAPAPAVDEQQARLIVDP